MDVAGLGQTDDLSVVGDAIDQKAVIRRRECRNRLRDVVTLRGQIRLELKALALSLGAEFRQVRTQLRICPRR